MMTSVDLLGGPSGQRHHHSVGPGGVALNAMGLIDCTELDRAPDNVQANSFDLLGGDTPQQQQQQQQQQQHLNYSPSRGETTYINASTVSITQSSAPTIVGLGKIEPSAANNANNNNNNNNKPKRKVIYVPTYSCNGGLDTKFNPHPRHARPSSLHNLLTPDEYEVAIQTLNEKIKRSRAKKLDYILLGTGPLMIPLALWGARHGKQVKQKRKLLEEGVWEFNELMQMDGKNVKMVWNRAKHTGGGESYLTIEEVEGGAAQNGKKVD